MTNNLLFDFKIARYIPNADSIKDGETIRDMKHWSGHKFFVLMLTIFVTIGFNLSAVQAGNMAVKMSIATDMDGMNSDGCGGCPGGDDAVSADCDSVCMVTAVAMLPAPGILDKSIFPHRFEILATAPRDGPNSANFTPPKS